MRNIETGRETLIYAGRIAKEALGIGEFQRMKKDAVLWRNENKPLRTISPTLVGAFGGFMEFMMPISAKFNRGTKDVPLREAALNLPDLLVDSSVLFLAFNGHYWEGVVAKLGYNILAQIAPDVAKLARDRVFQRAK